LAASNPIKKLSTPSTNRGDLVVSQADKVEQDPNKMVDSLIFLAPLEIQSGSYKLTLAESIAVQSGQICVISAGVGRGKSLLLEAILGMTTVQVGRIDLKTKYSHPWDLIRYLNQMEFYDADKDQSFYTIRLHDVEKVLDDTAGQLVVIDDPMMGMDARARNIVVETINQAKLSGATMVIASNDRQLVELSDCWVTISDTGQMQLRQKDIQS
jgi:ABC-type Mn2+/Zn2+ transport system ATPase subunit